MRWIELSIEAHAEAIDAVAEALRQHGIEGVAIEQPVQSHIEGEEVPLPVGMPMIKAYLHANDAAPEVIHAIEGSLWHLQAFGLSHIGPLQQRQIADEDWETSWKEHFYPLQIGRIVVKPSWREWDRQPDQIVVELDPGMAFGTGIHPTTRLMLTWLQDRVRPGMTVLDLGTGSGILSIAAGLMGARVIGLDISDIAIEVARGNVDANDLADRVTVGIGSVDTIAGQRYDLVLANIIASVLADLAPQLAAALVPDGELLASGIIEERVDLVRDAFTHAGLIVTGEDRDEDWFLLAARLPS